MKKAEDFYAGTITEVVDPVLYKVTVDIPGQVQGATAFPCRGEIDEPRVGDFVILLCLDPIYQSYYLYKKIKENDFIGFRSNGKMVDITPDYIEMGTFEETEYNDNDGYRPTFKDYIKMYSNGDIEIKSTGNVTIKVDGDVSLVAGGETTVQSQSINIKGPGKLTCKGTVVPGSSGPFIATPVTPSPGSPLPQGDTIILS